MLRTVASPGSLACQPVPDATSAEAMGLKRCPLLSTSHFLLSTTRFFLSTTRNFTFNPAFATASTLHITSSVYTRSFVKMAFVSSCERYVIPFLWWKFEFYFCAGPPSETYFNQRKITVGNNSFALLKHVFVSEHSALDVKSSFRGQMSFRPICRDGYLDLHGDGGVEYTAATSDYSLTDIAMIATSLFPEVSGADDAQRLEFAQKFEETVRKQRDAQRAKAVPAHANPDAADDRRASTQTVVHCPPSPVASIGSAPAHSRAGSVATVRPAEVETVPAPAVTLETETSTAIVPAVRNGESSKETGRVASSPTPNVPVSDDEGRWLANKSAATIPSPDVSVRASSSHARTGSSSSGEKRSLRKLRFAKSTTAIREAATAGEAPPVPAHNGSPKPLFGMNTPFSFSAFKVWFSSGPTARPTAVH